MKDQPILKKIAEGEIEDDLENTGVRPVRRVREVAPQSTSPRSAPRSTERVTGPPEVVGGTLGAAAGAVAGLIAGPPGAVVGAIVGAVAGVAAGVAVDGPSERELRDEELDRIIGVTEGDIGDPGLLHPEPQVGVYAAIGSTVQSEEGATDERKLSDGPIENIDD